MSARGRHVRFTVETRDAESLDALKAPAAKAYTAKGKVWGSLTTISAASILRSGQRLGEYTHEVKIPKPSYDLSIEDRLVKGSRYFSLVAPPDNIKERNEMLKLTVKEADS